MTSKRITPALLAASVVLTGVSQLFLGGMLPAHAITSVDELSDANRNSWAFEALQDLVEKYDVIEGYPDRTFRGNKAPTRWEMAAALDQLTKRMGEQLARLGAEKADKKDLATLARLQDEFRNELAALGARTSALETRASAIEAKNDEQDNRLALLSKTQIHGDMTFGGIADLGSKGVIDRNCGGNCGRTGINDSISTIGRLRLSLNVPVKEDNEESKIGEGTVYTRLVAAFGRESAAGAGPGNAGAYNAYSGYSRIAADASGYNEGLSTSNLRNNQLVFGNSLRQNLYVESAYYKQQFKAGIPLLSAWAPGMSKTDDWKTTGDLYVGVVPWRFLFDKSPFRGNELTQFQNTSFVNTPGIALNVAAPTVAYQWHQQLGKSANFDLTSAVSSINATDALSGLGVTYEGRLNYQTAFLGDHLTKPGSLYGGGYHIFNAGQTIDTVNASAGTLLNRSLTNGAYVPVKSSLNALYGGWSQEWYHGIGTQVSYMLSQNGPNNYFYNSTNFNNGANIARLYNSVAISVHQALSSTLTIPMASILPVSWGRQKDAIGVGYGFINFYSGNQFKTIAANDPRYHRANEQFMEAFYRFQATDHISIIPSYQLIIHSLGLSANGFDHAIGLRTSFTF